MKEGSVQVEGTSLHYVMVGDGRPLIVLHGGPGLGHSYLRPGLDHLATWFRLIYYDQRGSGRSEVGDSKKLSLSGAIEDLDGLRKAFDLAQVNLLGHSMGANIALLYGSRRPGQLASLVLANPGPPFDPEQQRELRAEMRRRMNAADLEAVERIQLSDGFGKRDPETVEEFIRTLYLPFFRDQTTGKEIAFGFTQITAENIIGAEEAMMGEFATLDMEESLAQVRAPTLVLHGELEPIPEAFPRFIADHIHDARYELIRGANHFGYIEDPERFFSAVVGFLEEFAS
jgi:proline iminopeptidase